MLEELNFQPSGLEFTPLDKANIELMEPWDFYTSEMGEFAVTCNEHADHRFVLETNAKKLSFKSIEPLVSYLESN